MNSEQGEGIYGFTNPWLRGVQAQAELAKDCHDERSSNLY